MSKRIQRNSICPLCNSGLKYKECCGKNEGLRGTNMRFIGDNKSVHTEFENSVFKVLGHYPDEYIDAVKAIGDVIYIIIDESNIGDYYSVGGVVALKSEIENNRFVSSQLSELADKYNIDYVHFTEIFGRKKILGDKRKDFIKEYVEIVKILDLKPFSVCMSESELKNFLKIDVITKEQCYIALTWILMDKILFYLVLKYKEDLIIEMWRENENLTLEKRILHQENANGIIRKFPFAHISIFRHYILFMKEEILFSSLSDFISYITIGICPKMKRNISPKELVNNYYDLLVIYNEIFKDSEGMGIEEFDKLLAMVRERKLHR